MIATFVGFAVSSSSPRDAVRSSRARSPRSRPAACVWQDLSSIVTPDSVVIQAALTGKRVGGQAGEVRERARASLQAMAFSCFSFRHAHASLTADAVYSCPK